MTHDAEAPVTPRFGGRTRGGKVVPLSLELEVEQAMATRTASEAIGGAVFMHVVYLRYVLIASWSAEARQLSLAATSASPTNSRELAALRVCRPSCQ